ncbi:g6086 [Coccomyxa viridis]|uniref:G6086 protein n=1 Tax=Coccomyxa viridis TaxID=1274662 RepID=A0ABP1FUI7_9CHLO
MLPGWFFFGWATWWMIGVFRAYMASSGKAPYSARAWYDFPWAKSIPLEPILKVVLTFIGINGELWFGHESWRTLHGADGRFIVDNINEWQHSAMYLAFLISGAVDLVGFYAPQGTLPPGTEQGCLGMAFVVEGLLFTFHLEGSELNWKAHLLLVMSILAAVGAILGEIAAPGNVLLGLARAQLVMLQGVWFMQIAKLLFEDNVLWDPRYHGSIMMVPVLYCTCVLSIMAATFVLFVGLRLWQHQVRKQPFRAHAKETQDEEEGTWVLEQSRKEAEMAVRMNGTHSSPVRD